ncbi:MAG TPA: alpha/beta fold hydrolase [Streptosporangiaceae bacterium]|nr:alpha/beta fold hydrolase [Streptosporangiaceae bacterium]
MLAATRLAGTGAERVLLVVGPSLGTAVGTLWEPCAAQLAGFEVVGWDLPGHGHSRPATEGFTVTELAASVRALANAANAGNAGIAGRPACYAGVSLGGAVAFELGLAPGPFRAVAAVAAASRIGEPSSWIERAELVRRAGTPVMVAGSAQRWFAPGFLERDGDTAERLLQTLSDADDESYSLACEALAKFDRRPDLDRVAVPFLLGPGEHDGVVPPARAGQDADAITGSRLQVFAGCGHLPPAESPSAVAQALTEFFLGHLADRAVPGN